MERIQSTADNEQASILWHIPTLPTVRAQRWASTLADHTRKPKLRIYTEPALSPIYIHGSIATTLKIRCLHSRESCCGNDKSTVSYSRDKMTISQFRELYYQTESPEYFALMQHFFIMFDYSKSTVMVTFTQ